MCLNKVYFELLILSIKNFVNFSGSSSYLGPLKLPGYFKYNVLS